MEMQQIRYFLALCEERNFTRAAKRCGVRQPSLTRAIRLLEVEFGAPLFERMGWKTRLSELGLQVRPYLAAIDRSAADAKRTAARSLLRRITSTPNDRRNSMRKFFYGAAVAAGAVFVAVIIVRKPHMATASQIKPSDIVDVRAIESTIDISALPRQDILSEADE
jgi:Bacterial regulatory helix-turn-helix protein, lysR family